MRQTSQDKIRPPLKWAGGKYQILDHIKKRLPEAERLIEPFSGSNAVFLNTTFKYYTLNDSNPDLVNFYQYLKKDGSAFIKHCRKYFSPRYNKAEAYYKLRKKFNHSDDPLLRAVLFLYLNRHGYNGLCRYNASGYLNVPFGRYKKPYFPAEELLYFAEKSRQATIKCQDFSKIISKAKKTDVVYCDPPYVPISNTANFTHYSAGGFNKEDQYRLVESAQKAVASGATVLISNHCNRITEKIYRDATDIHRFKVWRSISCNGNKRQYAKELLALYAPAG